MQDYLRFLQKELDRAISKFEEVDHSTAIGNLSVEEITRFWLVEMTRHPAKGTIAYIRLYWLGEVRRLRNLTAEIGEGWQLPQRKPHTTSKGRTRDVGTTHI